MRITWVVLITILFVTTRWTQLNGWLISSKSLLLLQIWIKWSYERILLNNYLEEKENITNAEIYVRKYLWIITTDTYNWHRFFKCVCVGGRFIQGGGIYIRQSLQNFNPWEGVYISTYIGLPRTLIINLLSYIFPCNFYIKDEKFAKIRFNF